MYQSSVVIRQRPDLSNYSSTTLAQYVNRRLLAAAMLRCSSLPDRDLYLREIS